MINADEFHALIEKINGFNDNGKKYIFFYDETNNYRKVRITNKGFNDPNVLLDNYTLGGICYEKGKQKEPDEMITQLKLQPNQELKAKKFFKGENDFKQCISNKRIKIILDWINNNAFIHYSDIDAIYFSVIDIVDSICNNFRAKLFPDELFIAFKDELYWAIRNDLEYFIDLCKKTNYPNISKENQKNFCEGLIEIINKKQFHNTLNLFKEMILEAESYDDLVFLRDNEPNTIMESFSYVKQQRCIIFNNSIHIFDREVIDEKYMDNEYMIQNNGKRFENFKFIDSKDEINIQISDIIIYLIAKYLKFLTFYSSESIKRDVASLKCEARNNLRTLLRIIDKSNQENIFFFETINSNTVVSKRQLMNQYIEDFLDL